MSSSNFQKNAFEAKAFGDLKRIFSDNEGLFWPAKLLERAYHNWPDRQALVVQQKTLTYRDLFGLVVEHAYKLQQHGIGQGDKVLLVCENSAEFFVAYLAVWHLGATIVPINVFLHEKELAYIVADANPKIIIASQVQREKLEQAQKNYAIDQFAPVLDVHAFIQKTTEVIDKDSILQAPRMTQDSLCVLLYTSGTTGTPKGVMLSAKNIMTNAMQAYARFLLYDMKEEERFFCVLPLFHVFAQNTCLWLPLMLGCSVVIVPKIDRKMILEGLEARPTVFLGFPALFGMLCMIRTAPLESIKFFVSGADMLPDKIRLAFQLVYGRKICAGYGLTEASPVVAANENNEDDFTTVVGRPLTGLECRVCDENGQIVSAGTIGTLYLKGDNIMMGYFNAPQATEQVLSADGWLNTGDLAYLTQDGMLAICGRNKDVIIHKGFNIYPAEVENILLRHPQIFKAAVIGKADDDFGQIPVAYVATKQMSQTLEKELKVLCNSNLASYKVPRTIVCLEDLPMSATGKVDKKRLKDPSTGL